MFIISTTRAPKHASRRIGNSVTESPQKQWNADTFLLCLARVEARKHVRRYYKTITGMKYSPYGSSWLILKRRKSPRSPEIRHYVFDMNVQWSTRSTVACSCRAERTVTRAQCKSAAGKREYSYELLICDIVNIGVVLPSGVVIKT